MTPEDVDQWLLSIERDRSWLADKLGIKMGTLYNGFSKGFTPRTIKGIRDLMEEAANSSNGEFEVTFTAREFERIEEARKLLGIATRKLYYEEAITEYTSQILAREAQESQTDTAQNISYFPSAQPSSGATEDPTAYDSSSGKRPRKIEDKNKDGTND